MENRFCTLQKSPLLVPVSWPKLFKLMMQTNHLMAVLVLQDRWKEKVTGTCFIQQHPISAEIYSSRRFVAYKCDMFSQLACVYAEQHFDLFCFWMGVTPPNSIYKCIDSLSCNLYICLHLQKICFEHIHAYSKFSTHWWWRWCCALILNSPCQDKCQLNMKDDGESDSKTFLH